jgi:NitT/TauT family transport system substrate-binding protein
MQIKMAELVRLVLALLIFCPSVSFGLERLRIGLSSVSAIHGALWVAQDKGLFKKYGIEPELIIIGGSASGISALIAGDIQLLDGGGDAVINASLRGADVILAGSVLNKGVQQVMARPEIKSVKELKGKKVGVTRFGSASHLVLELVMRAWGMSPGDVNVRQIGSSPAMLASLDKGGIDAAVLTMPSVFVAEEKGYLTLADLADMDIYYLHASISSTRRFLRGSRDQATRLIKGFVEGIAYFKTHKKESIEVLAKNLRTNPQGNKYLEKSYDLLAAKYYERVPYPSMRGVKTQLEFLGKDNATARAADPESFVDSSIVKELDASGFIKALYEK